MPFRPRPDIWKDPAQYDQIASIAHELSRILGHPIIPENLTTTQKVAIVNPGHGRMVLDTTLNKLCFYGTDDAWHTVTSV